jgi:hypothetical protein
MVGVALVSHELRRPGGQRPRPTPPSSDAERGGAVDMIQATLGQVLVVLLGLALVLSVIILLLLEAHYIVRLSRRLLRRLRPDDPDHMGSDSRVVDDDHSERRHDGQGVR